MKLSKNQAGEVASGMIAVFVVIAVVVGFGIGYASHKTKSVSSGSTMAMANATPSAVALDNSLVTLGVEHMALTDQAVNAALDGSPNAAATNASLYSNGNDIGSAVGSVYGQSAQKTFDAVWKLHLDQFVNYAVADKKGDSAAKQAALDAIQTSYTIPLAQYLAKANPYLPEKTLQTALSQHVAMTAMIIDDHVNADYTKEAADLTQANTMIAGIFSTLAHGIVQQYPSKFAN
jgi:hypothetical protein